MGFGDRGLVGFGFGFRILGFGFCGIGFWVLRFEVFVFGVLGFWGFEVWGLGSRVPSLGLAWKRRVDFVHRPSMVTT